MTVVIVAFFIAWAAASLLVLVPRFSPWLRSNDILGLVPEWKFFAPIPGRGDFYLLYRDVYPESTTDWTEIMVGGKRYWWNLLWNPRRRERKAMLDIARELPRHFKDENREAFPISVPYLTLLTYVSGQPRTVLADKTQFLLMYSEAALNGGQPQVNLLSYMHELAQ